MIKPIGGTQQFTAGCMFSGMGGFATGLCDAGFRIAWATDENPAACDTFRHRHAGVRVIERDIKGLSVARDNLEPIDLLAAGFPCQSFSQAGERKGFEDDRGRCFFDIPRIIKEFPTNKRPKVLLLENVDHILHGNGGQWFDRIQRDLRKCGYWFRKESCWRVNVKDFTSIPQDRPRVFMVAVSRIYFDYNPFRPPSKSGGASESDLNKFIDRSRKFPDEEYLPRDNRYRKMVAAKMEVGDSPDNLYQLRRSYVREKRRGLCPTLTANMGVGGHNVPFLKDDWGIRRLQISEVARLQGFRSGETSFPDAISRDNKYRLLGNAVCPDLARLVAGVCFKILSQKRC